MSIRDFEPISVLGQGGMGRVWEARHIASGQPVAVKILAPKRDGEYSFLNDELSALARLDHRNVMQIFDWGYVEGGDSDWKVTERQPFIVLELVKGTPLNEAHLRHWQLVRLTLLGILDALAHAHARGVIHRDLKPSNISVEIDGAQLDVRLLDFGIAQLHKVGPDETAEGLSLTGTPKYMAPEQIQGNRKVGPWTDLYSLGCIAFKLTTGKAPFTSGDRFDILRAHIIQPVPQHDPVVPVPDGFEAWANRLLEKHPADRYSLAADAAHDLMALSPPDIDTFDLDSILVDDQSPTEILGATLFDDSTWGEVVVPSRSKGSTLQPPPVPRTWRPKISKRFRANWATAALNLFHLRRYPLAGRQKEQDLLWETLLKVADGNPATVLVSGPSGIGKTRLTTWLGERAEEVGAARPLLLRSGEGPKAAGLMLRRFFGLHQNSRNALADVRAWFSRTTEPTPNVLSDCVTLVDLMFPEEAPDTRPQSPEVQHIALGRFLSSFERAVILTIDDASIDPYAMDLAAHVSGLQAPIMTVVNGGDLNDGSPEADTLRSRATHCLDLLPLDQTAQRELISSAAHLDRENASRLLNRAGGNPLYVLRILGDWVDSGYLKATDGRLTLDVADPPLPEDLTEVILSRLQRELATEDAWQVAELAATLGTNFVETELTDCVQEAGLEVGDVLEKLSRLDAIDRQFGIVQFCNEVSREALLQRAASTGQGARLHSICATTLGRHDAWSSAHRSRVAAHFAAADQHLQAAEFYLKATMVDDFYLTINTQAKNLSAYDHAIEKWGGSPSPALRSTRLRMEARQVANSGDVPRARILAAECLKVAEQSGVDEVLAHAHFMASQLVVGDDLEHGAQAIELFKKTGNGLYVMVVSQFHAADLAKTGLFEDARRMFQETFTRAKSLGEHPMAISVAVGYCSLLLDHGDTEAGRELLRQADAILELSPDNTNRAGSALVHAKLLFLSDDYDQARDAVAVALRIATDTRNGHLELVCRALLAGIEIAAGDVERCREVLAPTQKWRNSRLVALHLPIDIALAATIGDELALREGIDAMNEILDESPRLLGLGPWILELAAGRCQGELRDQVLRTSRRWWQILLLHKRVREIDALLAKD